MFRTGHIGIALLVIAPFAAVVAILLPPEWVFLSAQLALISSQLPDLDNSFPLSVFLTHRGFTHTILAAVIVSLSGGIFVSGLLEEITPSTPSANVTIFDIDPVFAFLVCFGSLLLGYLSHLLGDCITREGIKPYWPISSRTIQLPNLKAKSRLWNVTFFTVGVTGFVWILWSVFLLQSG